MSYTPNPTWVDGPSGGTPVEATPLNHADAGILDASNRLDALTTPAPQINRGNATVVTTYASGHGWTAANFATSNANDTADGRLSGQMLTGTTPGNAGVFPTFTKTGATALNVVGQCLRVWIKVDVPTNITAITLRAADTGGISASRYISWTALASSGGVYRTNGVLIPPNTWTELSFSLGSAFTSGTPNLAAITEYRWICQDNGTAATVHFGGIEAYPALAGRYPNGVVCLGLDDCYVGQYNLAMNVLSSFGYTATLFPIIDQIGAGGSYTLAQMQQMVNIGWEVAPHAYTLANHSGWNALSLAAAAADVRVSQAWIAGQGFGLSGMFAYPLGGFNGGFSGAVAPLCDVARTIDSTLYTESLPIGNELQLRSAAGIGGSGGIGVTTYTTATTGVLALAKAAGALVPMTFHDISSGTSGNINQCSIADFTTLITAIATAGMAMATYGEVLKFAMLGVAPAAPISAADASITITGSQNAQAVKVTPSTYPSASGGSASAGPTTPHQVRRDTLANWLSTNPVLQLGEVGYETDTACWKVGDGSSAYGALLYATTPQTWTPQSQGLIAATGDLATLPSQAAANAGRIMLMPVTVMQALTVNGLVTAYASATSGTTNTNTFIGVYDVATGSLLGQTADLASYLTTVAGAIVIQPFASAITGLKVGQRLYVCLLNNYSGGAGPVWLGTRMYGTNFTGAVTGGIPRVLTNASNSTYTSLPANVSSFGTLNGQSFFSLVGIGLTQ